MFGIFFNDLKISWYLLQYPCNPASQHRHIWWLPMLLLVDLPASHRVLKLRTCHDGVETCDLKSEWDWNVLNIQQHQRMSCCTFWMPCNDWFSGSDCADPVDFDSGICHGSWLCQSLKYHNSNFDVWFRHFIRDFSFRTEKKSSRQVFISQPLSPTECKVANIPWLNIFIRGEMTGDLVMVWTWCHSKCCKNIYGIYDIVTCPWLCNDEKGHDLSWSFMRCMMIQHLAMFFSSLKHLEVFFNYYIILYKSQERHLFNKARPVLGNACGSGVCSCDSVTRFGGPWLQW